MPTIELHTTYTTSGGGVTGVDAKRGNVVGMPKMQF